MTSKILGLTLAVCLLVGVASAAPPPPVMYGSAFLGPNSPATLYSINPATGAATPIGSGIGFLRVSSLAFAANGTLFGVGTRTGGSGVLVLIRINTTTGVGTEVGPLNSAGLLEMEDIDFRPSDGVLFGQGGAPADHVYTINTTTGAATDLGPKGGITPTDGDGLAFSPAGTLYTGNQTNLEILNQSTGAVISSIALVYGAGFVGITPRPPGMKFDPATGTLWAAVVAGFTPGVTTNSLATINIGTGLVTLVGGSVHGLDAIAIGPALPPVSVSVSPATQSLSAGQTQTFTATVLNTGNTAVTWSIPGGAPGSINSSGLYTAPTPAQAGTVVVTATSQADPTKSGTATVTLLPLSVSVSPAAPSLTSGQTQQFTATVTNGATAAVTWSIPGGAPGSISASGLYTAPAAAVAGTVVVTATSTSDPTKTGTATVTLGQAAPTPATGAPALSTVMLMVAAAGLLALGSAYTGRQTPSNR